VAGERILVGVGHTPHPPVSSLRISTFGYVSIPWHS
jgi:hypothetical protein